MITQKVPKGYSSHYIMSQYADTLFLLLNVPCKSIKYQLKSITLDPVIVKKRRQPASMRQRYRDATYTYLQI